MEINKNISLEVGDIIFTFINAIIFNKISNTTDCWSNHVGIIIGKKNGDYIVAESSIPFSHTISLTKFIARSKDKKFAVSRLKNGLSSEQKKLIEAEALKKMNIIYHLGFDFESKFQFCSKFVYEIYRDALSIELGNIETFSELLQNNPRVGLFVWRVWFFGRIPWERKTITPASIYNCHKLKRLIEKI